MYLRLSRGGVPNVHGPVQELQLGLATKWRESRHVALVANGMMMLRAVEAAEQLEQEGVQARVLNMAALRPLDAETIAAAAEERGCIVTAEEHSIHGGLGGAVAEVVTVAVPVPVRMAVVPHAFRAIMGSHDAYARSPPYQPDARAHVRHALRPDPARLEVLPHGR